MSLETKRPNVLPETATPNDADSFFHDGVSGTRRTTWAALKAIILGAVSGSGNYNSGLVVPSIAAMKAQTFSDALRLVTVRGAQGGVFYHDPDSVEAVNNGTIFAPDAGGGRLKRIYSGAINVKWFGAVGDGAADDTAAIQLAIDAAAAKGGGNVFFPSGTYLVIGLNLPSRVTIIGDGIGVSILKKNAGAIGTHIIDLLGSETATVSALTADAAIGSNSVAVASGTGFAAGDIVLVRDATYAYTTFGRNQELRTIESVAGSTITFTDRLIRSYATSSTAQVVKVTAVKDASIRDLELQIPAGTNGGGVHADLANGLLIERVKCTGPNDDPAFGLLRSAKATIRQCEVIDAQNQSLGGYGYAVLIDESTHESTVEGCMFNAIRENNISAGARLIHFHGNRIFNAYDSGVNTHGGGAKDIFIEGNMFSSCRQFAIAVGFSSHNAGDRNVAIKGNFIYNSGASAIVVNAPSDGTKRNVGIVIEGNTISGVGTITASSYGILLNYSDELVVKGNKIVGLTANVSYGIAGTGYRYTEIEQNTIQDIPNGWGIGYLGSCDTVKINRNILKSISSSNIRNVGSNTGITGYDNQADDSLFTFAATDAFSFSFAGLGSPELAVAAPIGSTYRRIDGGAGTTFYVKESGTGNTGWVAK